MSATYAERQGVIKANTTVYSEPTTSGARLLVMKPGEIVQAVDVHGGGWLTTFFSKGGNQVQGYFQASNLELFGQDWSFDRGAVIGGALSARVAPSTSAAIGYTLRDGFTIQFAYLNANWVRYNFTVDGTTNTYYSPRDRILLYDPPHTNVFSREAIADVYARAAPWQGSSILKTYTSGTTINMIYFNSDWGMGSVTVNDEKRTAFFDLSKF